MDIKELKQLVKNSSSVVVVDDGEPAFVIVNYETYRNLAGKGEISKEPVPLMKHIALKTPPQTLPESEMLEKLNKEILALQSQIAEEERNIKQNGGNY